ncbi:hypothetical protein NDU88_000655 [Pleurodeles waltl]|uniref:Uncharacterized protein n=1 Tax=Pleurodeles waltl TaxID=8319 RepID=A0AAV7L768_PLEWA|nr:hypothetical protein NDU88_000655 [Pleurodeles waltl]
MTSRGLARHLHGPQCHHISLPSPLGSEVHPSCRHYSSRWLGLIAVAPINQIKPRCRAQTDAVVMLVAEGRRVPCPGQLGIHQGPRRHRQETGEPRSGKSENGWETGGRARWHHEARARGARHGPGRCPLGFPPKPCRGACLRSLDTRLSGGRCTEAGSQGRDGRGASWQAHNEHWQIHQAGL